MNKAPFVNCIDARQYIGQLFTDRMRRHDFTDYIRDRLAGDFAFTLAGWIFTELEQPTRIHCEGCMGHGEVLTGTVTHQGYNQPPEHDLETCPECSGEQSWYVAKEIDVLVRQLDIALNGPAAAAQARLSDIVAQVEGIASQSRVKLVGFCDAAAIESPEGATVHAKPEMPFREMALFTRSGPGEVDLLPQLYERAISLAEEQGAQLQGKDAAVMQLSRRLEVKERRVDELASLLHEVVQKHPRVALHGDLHERIAFTLNGHPQPSSGEPDPIIQVLKNCLAEGANATFSGGDLKHLISLLEAGK